MTRKLYNENSMIHEFEAVVIACEEYKNNGEYKIILDQTAFFPTGGGQTADAGWLSFCIDGEEKTIEVIDGKEAGDDVWHITKAEVSVGTKVKGKLDWEQRFSKMQQHTGEHIVSGIVAQKYGYTNVGFHLGTDVVTMDFDGELDREQLNEIEFLANKVIWNDVQVKVLYPTDEELERIDYRSKIEIEGQVRVVQIPGVDSCACCAPHVESTGVLGLLKMTDVVKHRGGVRINLKCGDRALTDYQEKSAHSKDISRILSLKEVQLTTGVERLNQECLDLRYKLKNLELQLVESRVREVLSGVGQEKLELLVLFENSFNIDQNKQFVNLLIEDKVNTCISFVPINEEEFQFVAASFKADVREIAKLLREKFNAKGGGSATMVQGRIVATRKSIEEVLSKNVKDRGASENE